SSTGIPRFMIRRILHLLIFSAVVGSAGFLCQAESCRSPGEGAGRARDGPLDPNSPIMVDRNPSERPDPIYCKSNQDCPSPYKCVSTLAPRVCLLPCDTPWDCPHGWLCTCRDRDGGRYTGCADPPPGFCLPANT